MRWVNVIACLGKRLHGNGDITEEYRKRIDKMIGVLRDLTEQQKEIRRIIFSGGKGEAVRGVRYFLEALGDDEIPNYVRKIHAETRSKNTIENIMNICTELRMELQSEKIDLQNVHLILISSDYHVDRILMVDRLMPLQSLCAPLHELVGKLSFYRACYPHDKSASEVYRLKDLLNVMRVNLEGVCGIAKRDQGYEDASVTVDRLIPEGVDLFEEIVDRLSKAPGEGKDSDGILESTLLILETCRNSFRSRRRKLLLSEDDRDELKKNCRKLDCVMKKLDKFDPDYW
jgi:hypothetical protein